jgi:mRNA interferase RelE/StbE
MTYDVKLKPSALKQLKKLDKKQAERIVVRIYQLAENPYPSASTPLVGTDAHRLRVGDYRIIYTVSDRELMVLVVRLGHRRDVYK